jgi:1,2-diacylglycerol 3-alpha-glucosyltransferase
VKFWRKDSQKKNQDIAPLRICILARRFPILGRATDQGFLWSIARGLAKKGHEVVVLSSKSPMGKSEVHRDGVLVYYLLEDSPDRRNSAERRFDKIALEKFKELHKVKKFDLVHSMDRSGIAISRLRKDLGVSVAFDVEATQMSQIFSILGMAQENVRSQISTGIAVAYKFLTTFFGGDRELLKTADGVFVTTPNQRLSLERYYLYPDFHIHTVPYGLEIGDLSAKIENFDLKTKNKWAENSHVVLTITDMMEPNEIIVLLNAFERLAVKKPNTYMVIIGNGPGWKTIEYNILNLALGNRVLMAGDLSEEEISQWLSMCEVYVNLSSRTTGFEPTLIEAMAQKKVVIGSEVSPIANVIAESQDGFLIRPADSDALSHLMVEIFSGTLPIQDIGQRAREKVINLFDPIKMVQAVEESYRKIIKFSN